jgi:hypothetical protein
MQALPFDLIRQLPPAPRGTRYIYNANQILLINVNTRLVLDFINIPISDQHRDAYTRKPAPKMVDQIPSYEEQHPSQSHQPPSHSRSYEVAQGKPFTEDEHPSSHGQADSTIKGKPDKGEDHPSMHAQSNNGPGHNKDKGKPQRGDKTSLSQAQEHKGNKRNQGGPPEDKGRLAKMDKRLQGGGQKGNNQDDRPFRDKGKPSKDSLIASSDESPQTPHQDKPDKGDSRDKGKHKEIRADFSKQDDSSDQSFSQKRNEGKPVKQDRGSPSNTSVLEDMEQAQVATEPKENLQIAKVESGRGKGKPKNSGKPEKKKRGKPQQQTSTPDLSQIQESAPVTTPPQPTTTASFAPAIFDNDQRTVIQSYYQNSRPESSAKGKGKGKSSRRQKRNNTVSVAKNDILTQPTDPLPSDLESQLPPAPPNTRRAIYQQQVVLIQIGTNRVLDVIQLNN